MKLFRRVFHDITNVSKKNIKLTIHKSSHRKKLIRWLYEVIRDFKYSQSTFGLTIYILDSYTQQMGFDINSYQLIGITSLFIAAKLEERATKPLEDYLVVTDNLVSAEELINMERMIIVNIQFDIKIPHSYLKLWYLKRMTNHFTMKERQEILFSAFACIIEKNASIKNIYCVYLEGIREAERIMSGSDISKDLEFYIKNNRVIRHIDFKSVTNKLI
ncbi:cyclin-family protein [Vairimorpha necatrix]|uniref:Cyclin-family protein n=1 Tax=Vairimorpha necatrix TaxID=6039 RepID=A0AAX4JGE4_9MICR